jgi:RecB family endonuclease NucS
VKESTLENDILQYLRYMGIMCWKTHDPKHRPCEMGIPDIMGCLGNGRLVAIEVKRPGKKASTLQSDFINKLQAYNALAFVATSLTDVQAGIGK